MTRVGPCAVPEGTLLAGYLHRGAYVDCYATEIAKPVSQAHYVEAFYTTRLFKVERLILRLGVSRPSTDRDAQRLARGEAESFAAWTVEARNESQLLLRDFTGRTRSWLMSAPATGGAGTRLYFGSAVVPAREGGTGLGAGFHALLGFHKVYSRALLSAARSRLEE